MHRKHLPLEGKWETAIFVTKKIIITTMKPKNIILAALATVAMGACNAPQGETIVIEGRLTNVLDSFRVANRTLMDGQTLPFFSQTLCHRRLSQVFVPVCRCSNYVLTHQQFLCTHLLRDTVNPGRLLVRHDLLSWHI